MRPDTSDQVLGVRRSAGIAADLIAAAGVGGTVVDVQRLVTRLRDVPGVLSAALGGAESGESSTDLSLPVGPPAWQLQLRVGIAGPDAYDEVALIAREIAAAADRALTRGCGALAGLPGPQPPPLYRAITVGARALIVAVDPAGNWTPLSDAFCAVLGYDRLSPPGGRMIDLIHPDDRAAAVATFVTSCSGAHPAGAIDLRLRTADGQWRVLETVVRSFVDDPQVGVVVYFAIDVTAQRAAELSAHVQRGRLATLVETLSDGILLLSVDGRIELVNDASRRLFDLADDSTEVSSHLALVGHDWADLLDSLRGNLRNAPSVLTRLSQAVTGERAVVGEELEFHAGRVLELELVPVRTQGSRMGTLVHVRDVTARVAARRGLEERSRGLEERNRSLAEATAMNNEFVAMVAHELRGPLSSVVAFSHLLGEVTSGDLNTDQRTYVDVIDRNANRLLRLIEDLLLLSRLESRTLQLRPTTVHLPDLIAAAVAERTPAAMLSGITLVGETSAGPDVLCDDTRIHQVIDNLISNALKFTPNGGQVAVRARHEPDAWTIEVSDSGIGIPATDLPRLFRAFFRGASPPSSVGRHVPPGTGLGLVVCRAIVELHGGAIGVASTEGVGTTVTLSLPTRPLRKPGG